MEVSIQYEDESSQGDFKNGAITIHCSDPNSTFELGQMFERLWQKDKQVVSGKNHGGVFIRIPLTNKDHGK